MCNKNLYNISFVLKKLKEQIKSKCNICGNIEDSQWKDCGCYQEGFNDGIKKSIEFLSDNTLDIKNELSNLLKWLSNDSDFNIDINEIDEILDDYNYFRNNKT